MIVPSYVELKRLGELHERVEEAYRLMSACRLCPRCCGADRMQSRSGACGTGSLPVVSSYGAHFGEEPPIVGMHGSGTIFFGGCNLDCAFCQNHEISHGAEAREIGFEDLATIMLDLTRQGCHNINLVSPTHQLPQILASIEIAAEAGLDVPIVYNTGGYESVEALRILDGVVDIYMPDVKYGSNEVGLALCGVPDYWDRCREAVVEMHSQVGDLSLDDRGIAEHGLLVRHLVLPNGLAHTREVARFLARDVSADTYINVMDQYHPDYRAIGDTSIGRRVTRGEYDEAVRAVREEGLWRLAD